jgi:hypothetical protein
MRLEIANHHTRPKSKCPTNNTRNEKECILLVEQQQLLTPRDSNKEKLSFAVLSACSLSEISRKSDSRAYFLCDAQIRETRLCEKKELRKNMKKCSLLFGGRKNKI